MAVDIDTLQIEIEAESKTAAEQLNSLVEMLERLKTATTNRGKSVESFAKKLEILGDATQKLADSKRLGAFSAVLKHLSALNDIKIPKALPDRLASIGTSMNSISSEALENLDSMTRSLERLSGVDLSGLPAAMRAVRQSEIPAVEVSQPEPEAVSAASETPVDATTETQIEKTTEKVGILRAALEKVKITSRTLGARIKYTFSNAITKWFEKTANAAKKLASALKSVSLKGLGSGLKSVGSHIVSQFTSPFQKAVSTFTKWKNAIGRIAFYRAVRSAIKIVTDGLKEGVNNLYQYSTIVGTSLAPAMNSIATSAQYLKNSIGAMAAPLIEAIAPAIDYLIEKFVQLINVIGKAFAALTGKSTYSQATKQAKQYADAASGAAEATQNFLLGIDALTIMDNKSGGGGGVDTDYGSMFEEVEIPAETMDWAAKVREAIEDGKWREAGSILAEKLNEVIDGWDANEWGNKLGKKIKNGLNLIYGFMTTFDFQKLGTKLASALNGIFSEVDFDLAGRTLATKWNAIIDILYGFVDEFMWSDFGTEISEAVNGWFDEINWEKAGQAINKGLSGVITSAIAFIEGTEWGGIAKNFVDFLTNIEWVDLLGDVGTLIGDAVVAALEFVFGLGESGLFEVGGEIIAGLLLGIGHALSTIGEWLKLNVVDPIVNKVKELFGIHSPSTVFKEIGVNLILGLFSGISNTWVKITSFFSEKLSSLKKSISSAWSSIKETTSQKWTDIKTTITEIWNSIWANIKGVINSILGGVESMANGVVKGLNKIIQVLNGLSFEIPDWVPEFGGKTFGFNINQISTISIPKLESGGLLKTGQMFIARESGPEMVGKIGQQTAVANNAQIVDGISSGVKDANEDVINTLYAVAQQIISAVNNVANRPVVLNGRKVSEETTSAQNRQNRIYGKTLQNA